MDLITAGALIAAGLAIEYSDLDCWPTMILGGVMALTGWVWFVWALWTHY